MTMFDDREKAFEAKYRLDQETQFKVNLRRDKLLGLWAAEHLGLSGDAAKAYALSVVDVEFSGADHDASHKVMSDFTAKGVAVTEHQVQREFARLAEVARAQIIEEGGK
ncbi:DUF1476 domain-containing protein [Magnetospirillum aberrantis]|uniref:DUF1476 domain-containing protein n=1 Tax=Magnetospirillum aberrantis SpK TaxID=908842 RepID=A0A7C9UTQ3_9PROT|nr:DUF1476 domain-containing protein [Magnetospirillum aberrantis]NFV78789.1 DUF1476 domain-containing protein [Magnetospirillum aberrantis SpK]